MRDYGFFVLHVVLHKRCFDYSIKRLTNLSIFAMREKMKQKTFDDPYSFFRVASTVIQWNWKYFTIILACL